MQLWTVAMIAYVRGITPGGVGAALCRRGVRPVVPSVSLGWHGRLPAMYARDDVAWLLLAPR